MDRLCNSKTYPPINHLRLVEVRRFAPGGVSGTAIMTLR